MKPLDEGCSIGDIPIPDVDEHKRRMVRVAIPITDGMYQCAVHHDCIHNQLQAIHNRVCGKVPHPTEEGVNQMRRAAARWALTVPITSEESIFALGERNSGQKGARYIAAAHAVCQTGVSVRDSYVKMFVKAERFSPNAKRNPDPRAVQFRGAKYCVNLSMYLRPVEEHLYQTTIASKGVYPTRNVAKGLNSVQRAELLIQKMSQFEDPAVFEMDASRFDQHVTVEHLKVEHSIYLASNSNPEFKSLLEMQLYNKCFTTKGLRYKTAGRRMSGDMNTAIGNVVLMLVMIIAAMDVLEVSQWDCLDDGDDIVVIVDRGVVDKFRREIVGVFLQYGMEMKVELPKLSIHRVVFCRSQVVEFSAGKCKFVRDYRDVLSKALCGVRNWENPSYRERTLNAIGVCELILGLGVPVLQAFSLAILRNTRGKDLSYAPAGLLYRTKRDMKLLGIKDLKDVRVKPIELCARESFESAFGLEIHRQIAIEHWFDQWTFRIDGLAEAVEECDVPSWVWVHTSSELYHVEA